MRGTDYHRGILAWLPEIWSMQQEAGVEGGEFDDENDINKSYHDLYVETALARSDAFAQRPISDAALLDLLGGNTSYSFRELVPGRIIVGVAQ